MIYDVAPRKIIELRMLFSTVFCLLTAHPLNGVINHIYYQLQDQFCLINRLEIRVKWARPCT